MFLVHTIYLIPNRTVIISHSSCTGGTKNQRKHEQTRADEKSICNIISINSFYIININIIIYSVKVSRMNTFDRAIKVSQQEFEKLYQQKDLIDSGSYGVVIRFVDKTTKQSVAIKFLKDHDGLEGFEKEEQIMKQIDHENVLKCLGFYYNTTKSQYFLVTTYCQRNNLKTCLPEIRQFDEKRKVWLCLQIARGINALHEINIMHRDIKPANILVTADWQLKVCDFGFGKLDHSLKQTVKVGTPMYRDPNVNLGRYSKKCDIYSVGLVFDSIFRGQSVFNKVPEALFQKELNNFKQKKREIINKLNCSDKIKEIILGCLQSDETKRTSSKTLLAKMEQLWGSLNPKNDDQQYERAVKNQIVEANERKFTTMAENMQHKKDSMLCTMHQMRIQTEPNTAEDSYVQSNFAASQFIPSTAMNKKHSYSPTRLQSSRSLSQSTNDPNFLAKLLSTRGSIDRNIGKNSNFQTIYKHFVERKNKIRELDQLSKVESIPRSSKKIVIFIAMFGYLRFLKVNKFYLKEEKSLITDIEGVRIEDISKKTIEICLDLIQKEIVLILKKIKPFLNDLDMDKIFYKELLTKNVLSMIDYGISKKFLEVENYQREQIAREYEDILMNNRFYSKAEEEIALKSKLLQIKEIF